MNYKSEREAMDEAMGEVLSKLDAMEEAQLLRKEDPSSVARAAAYGEACGMILEALAQVEPERVAEKPERCDWSPDEPTPAPSACSDCFGLGDYIDVCIHCGHDYAKDRREKPAPVAEAGELARLRSELRKWERHHEDADLEEMQLQSEKSPTSLAALTVYNTALHHALKHARRALTRSLADDPAAVERAASSDEWWPIFTREEKATARKKMIAALRAAEGKA